MLAPSGNNGGIRSEPGYPSLKGVSVFILRVIRDAVLIVNHDLMLFANRAFEELCGFANSKLISNEVSLFPPEERAAFFKIVREHLDAPRSLVESIVECHHGTQDPFLVRVAFHPFHDELDNGACKCVCVFTEPLFYKPLFEYTSAFVAMIEYVEDKSDCVLLKANPFAMQFFGSRSAEGIIAKSLVKHLGFSIEAEDHVYFKNPSSDPYLKRFSVTSASHSGAKRYLHVTLTYLGRSLRGRSLFTLVGDDVSEVVNLQLQLADSKVHANQQMNFFAKMVHELRTPLSGMLGMSTLLRNTTLLTRDQSDMVRTIQTCGDSVLSLIGNILDLSNLERNNGSLAIKPFNLLDCIEDALDITWPEASLKKVNMYYEAGPLLSEFVVGDMIRVRQILLNLLMNAIKFTPNGGHVGVRVTEEPRAPTDQMTKLRLAVEDDGIGIAEEAQARIFESFMQVNSPISHLFGGNGLGLAIVKVLRSFRSEVKALASLVSLMGGNVSVQSKPGQGTTFLVLLPLPYTQATPPSAALMSAMAQLHGRKASVIVTDPKMDTNLSRRIAALGLTIVRAEPGAAELIVCNEHDMKRAALLAPNIVVLNHHDAEWADGVQQLRQPYSASTPNLVDSPVAESDSPASKRPRSDQKRVSGSPTLRRRILVVDDNIVSRRVTQKMIEAMGFPAASIYAASNGVEAIESLRLHKVDLILMDIDMPVLDGITATMEIRKLSRKHQMPLRIVACTATDTKEQRARCKNAGMDEFLTKPVSYDALKELLEQL